MLNNNNNKTVNAVDIYMPKIRKNDEKLIL